MDERAREQVFDPPLWMQRRYLAGSILKKYKLKRVFEAGCGEGMVLGFLAGEIAIEYLSGIDIQLSRIKSAQNQLKPRAIDFEFLREKSLIIDLYHGDILKLPNSARFCDFDAIICLEVIEHLWPKDLDMFAYRLFSFKRAPILILSTPNKEFNAKFTMEAEYRDIDHKFEWTRNEFQGWCNDKAENYGYNVEFTGVGILDGSYDEKFGFCTQFAIFKLSDDFNDRNISPVESDNICHISHIEFPYFKDKLGTEDKIRILVESAKKILSWRAHNVVHHLPYENIQSLESLKTLDTNEKKISTSYLWSLLEIRQIFQGETQAFHSFLRANGTILTQKGIYQVEDMKSEKDLSEIVILLSDQIINDVFSSVKRELQVEHEKESAVDWGDSDISSDDGISENLDSCHVQDTGITNEFDRYQEPVGDWIQQSLSPQSSQHSKNASSWPRVAIEKVNSWSDLNIDSV